MSLVAWLKKKKKDGAQMFIAVLLCNKQKLERTQMPTHRWMVKQIVTYPYNGIFLSNKKEWSNDTHNKRGNLNYVKWKETNIYVIPFMWNARRCKLNYRDRKQINMAASSLRRERLQKVIRKLLGGDEYVQYLDCNDDFTSVHICQNVSILPAHVVL